MQYDISLKITHDYSSPADAGRHALRLLPITIAGQQRLIAGRLDLAPAPSERADRIDFFGNHVTDVVYRHPHASIDFKLHARVERFAASAGFDISPPLPALAQELASLTSVAADQPLHFLSASQHIVLDTLFRDYALDCLTQGMSTWSAVEAIGQALHRDMTFDPEATSVETPALEAFERRHGVCQDFSHIMISALRGIGIPAGYVSGFLRTLPPKGQERLEGADAMHAWVRAWCGIEVGWIEYDPTNAIRVGTDHVVVAYGRDYGDVAPVKGVLRTSGKQSSKHAVDVVLCAGETVA